MIYARNLISNLFQLLTLIVIINAFLSFFVSPYNKFRMILDKIVGPMLRPIQRLIPPLGNIDFSPIILIFILQIIERFIYILL